MNWKEKGFTLIELLAVIIILAVIALIVTPVVLKVVDSAKESARRSSVAGYADAVKLDINEKAFQNHGINPVIDEYFLSNIVYQGNRVTCNEVKNTNNYGVVLKECNVGSDASTYCFAKGKVYSCDNSEFINIYNSINVDNSEEKTYKDNSGANRPTLYSNMIPVRYDGTNWIYADTTQKWYDYDSKEWANAVVLISSPSKTYKVGDSILMSDISQMYVWIPRYKYTIFNGNNESSAAQLINVTFESGTASTGTVICSDAVAGSGSSSETCTDTTNSGVKNGTSTYTHPVFTFGTTSLTGLWAGKFETGNVTSCTAANNSVGTGCDLTTLGIQIKPNVSSWRGARVSTYFTSISNIDINYGINADSHMMKNIEWGAIAYLEASKYGLGTTDIGINNNSSYTTGCGAESGSSPSTTCNSYDTTNGKLASTTGNIYGVYDMSGGAYEYAMGDMVTSSNVPMVGYQTANNYNSGFTGKLYDGTSFTGVSLPDNKYYDKYTYDSASNTNHGRGKLGDATKETLVTYGNINGGWYSDYAAFIYSNSPWFIRGGYCSYTFGAGVFNFNSANGYANAAYSARTVLVKNN